MISKTDNLRFWSYQAKKVIATIIDPQDQLDAVSIFSPLLMDPQNIGQLVIQQGSTDTVLTKTYSETEMIDLSRRLKAAWPYKSQKIVLENRVAGSRFTMNQIDKIIAIIDMFNDKKEVATMLLPSVIDPQNIDMLFDTFWTEPDKAYINGLIKKKPMKYLPKMGNQETK